MLYYCLASGVLRFNNTGDVILLNTAGGELWKIQEQTKTGSGVSPRRVLILA
jgi:hypothetical protein